MTFRQTLLTILTTAALACLTALQPARAAEPIVIGAAIAQSGFAAPYDHDPSRAAEIAIEAINAKGGVLGRPLKMIYADTKSDLAHGAVAGMEVLDSGADIVIVTGDYDFGGGAARAANARGKIAISPFAADPKFGVQGIGPYAFTFSTASLTVGTVMAEFCWDRGWRTAYTLTQNTIQYDPVGHPLVPRALRGARRRAARRGQLRHGRRVDRPADHAPRRAVEGARTWCSSPHSPRPGPPRCDRFEPPESTFP